MIAAINIIIAVALIKCITFRLKLVGLFGSFFLKKYMNKFSKKRRLTGIGKPSEYLSYFKLFLFELNAAVQYTALFS